MSYADVTAAIRERHYSQVHYTPIEVTARLLEQIGQALGDFDIKIGDTVYVLLRKPMTAEIALAGKPDITTEEGMVALMLANDNIVIKDVVSRDD